MIQGIPNPRKMLKELLPLILPILASAVLDSKAACLLANVSGRLVPMATNVIAVMLVMQLAVLCWRFANSRVAYAEDASKE